MGDGPVLTKLSNYKSTPKWTFTTSSVHSGVRNDGNIVVEQSTDADPVACIDRTSKFRRISASCKFGTSKRFNDSASTRAPPGPGQYTPPPDYSIRPYRSICSITFGSGGRLFPKFFHNKGKGIPSPSDYDIRGKHRNGGFTFDTKGVTVNNRHGWFYDTDIRSRRDNPAPGAYDPRYPTEQSDQKFSFGTGDRPPIHHLASSVVPSPGQYDAKSTLGGPKFSFTHTGSTVGSMYQRSRESTVGPLCGQPTQFA